MEYDDYYVLVESSQEVIDTPVEKEEVQPVMWEYM